MSAYQHISFPPENASKRINYSQTNNFNQLVFKLLLLVSSVLAIVTFIFPPYDLTTKQFTVSNFGAGLAGDQTPELISVLADIKTTSKPPFVDQKRLISKELDPYLNITSSDCQIEDWNNVHTDTIPYSEMIEQWIGEKNGYKSHYLYHKMPSLLAAFAYKDYITVTLNSENYYGKTVYCRYYDCNRKEIPRQFVAKVFPEATVNCGRRRGAKYISISETLEEKPEMSVPIRERIQPKHFFTVCLATLYGPEPKFSQVVDFVEYYKLQGASYFHVYIRNVTDYDRILLDDYARTNDIELIKMHDHYWREDFMWHHVQINDCHHRNKYFSKWTAFIDIDERIEVKKAETVAKYLETIDSNINSLQFSIQWVFKNESSPARYINESQLINELPFRKYHNTTQVGIEQPKCIIRPDRIAVMTIHWATAAYKGEPKVEVNKKEAVIRHYRNTYKGPLLQSNVDIMYKKGPFSNTDIDPSFSLKLTRKIVERVKWVYDTQKVSCAEIQRTYYFHGLNATC